MLRKGDASEQNTRVGTITSGLFRLPFILFQKKADVVTIAISEACVDVPVQYRLTEAGKMCHVSKTVREIEKLSQNKRTTNIIVFNG